MTWLMSTINRGWTPPNLLRADMRLGCEHPITFQVTALGGTRTTQCGSCLAMWSDVKRGRATR